MLVHHRDDATPAQCGGSVAEFEEDIRVRYALALVEGTSADIPNKCKIADEDASVPDLVEHYARYFWAASQAKKQDDQGRDTTEALWKYTHWHNGTGPDALPSRRIRCR